MTSSISYIIYIYNQQSLIEDLFKSLAAQKGSFRREFIIVDDGSEDNSLKEIKKHIHLLTKATILSHEHVGSAMSLAKALSITHNEYIFLTAANNLLSKDASNVMSQACAEHKVDIVFASGREDKSYHHLLNPLFDVICSLEGSVGQLGEVPTLIKASIIEEANIDQHSYTVAPVLALFLALDYEMMECPVSYEVLPREPMLSEREKAYYILHSLSQFLQYAEEEVLPMRRELYFAIIGVIKNTRSLSIQEWLRYGLVKYTHYTPKFPDICDFLKQELQKLI